MTPYSLYWWFSLYCSLGAAAVLLFGTLAVVSTSSLGSRRRALSKI